MRKIILLLVILTLCNACKKRENIIVLDNNDLTPAPTKEIIEKIKNHNTIADYLKYSNETEYEFHIIGNFTGSGNLELLAFYQFKDFSPFQGIDVLICFVLNSEGNKIENIYNIDFTSVVGASREEGIAEKNSLLIKDDTGMFEADELGRPIIWLNRVIGRVSDFNNNGLEELYLISNSGTGSVLSVFEYNNGQFVEYLNLSSVITSITNIENDEKIIHLKLQPLLDDTYFKDENNITIRWNIYKQSYELLPE